MATTTPTKSPTANSGKPATTEAAQVISPPQKLRRRPLMIVAAFLAVCLGGLIGVFAFQAVSTARDVVAVRQTIERGGVITRDNLMTVKVSIDPALKPVPGAEIDQLVGKRAAYDIVSGGVITRDQVTDQSLPARGNTVVGISLGPGMAPTQQIKPGDAVRIIPTPGQQGEVPAKDPATIPATVVTISVDEATGNTNLAVLVPSGVAARVAAIASTGRAAIVLDSQER